MEHHHQHDHSSPMMMMTAASEEDEEALMLLQNNNGAAFCINDGSIMYMDGFQFSLRAGRPCLNLLFSNWTLNSRTKFLLAVVGTFLFAIFVEGFSKLRHTIVKEARITSRNNYWKRRLLRASIPVFHGFQALAGYLLMLISMTFSVELLFAVVLGLATGYGVFFANAADQQAADLRQHVTTNPCCEFMEEESKEALLSRVPSNYAEDDGGAILILEGEESAQQAPPSSSVI